ncbi:MAG: DASS family sodium-coupled anion symporter [Helicobacteraceae bacterium]|nr:DASS family sodium-coupled anion symporter [Helicobacteraceae bacterium]
MADKRVKNITIAVLAAVGAYAIGFYGGLSDQHARLLGAVVLLVALWTNEGLPLGVVSLLPIAMFPALGILSVDKTAGNYANGIIFLFLGGFMLALAVEKTELHKLIAHKLLKIFPASARGAIFALSFTSGMLSTTLSNTTTALLLMPLAHFLASDIRLKMRLALAIAFGASVGGITTPIATPPNLILFGFLNAQNMSTISFMRWIALMTPLAILMLIALASILSIGAKDMKLTYSLSQWTPVTKDQKKLGAIILILAALLALNSPIEPYYGGLGLNEQALILFFGLLLFMPGLSFIDWNDSKKIPYEIIFLFGAGFALSQAFLTTGLDKSAANAMAFFVSKGSLTTLIAIIFAMCFLAFAISNTAKASIALPIVYSLCLQGGFSAERFLLAATVCASFSFLLPISTPPNAIAFSSGALKIKDMAFYGFIFTLIGSCLLIATVYGYWTLFLI